MSTNFNVNEFQNEKFYQLPKVFFINPEYKVLSNDAKIAYAILRDRLDLSIKNNWIDENGDIFFIYTNDALKKILNISSPNKLSKIKKELEKAGLFSQIRVGLNKPNKLYLKKPIVRKEDVYKISHEETIDEFSNDTDVSNSYIQKYDNDTSRNMDLIHQDISKSYTSDTDINDTDISDTDISDTNNMNDNINIKNNNYSHSNHANYEHTTSDDLSEQEEIQYELQEFPEQLAKYLSNYSLEEVKIVKAVILKAKQSFHKERADEIGMPYRLEDFEDELIKVLKRFRIILKKKNETVSAMQGYLMRCVKSEFEEQHVLIRRRSNMNDFNLFD